MFVFLSHGAAPAGADETANYRVAGPSITLGECYRWALENNEGLGMAKQAVIEAKAHYLQALGLVAPGLSLGYTSLQQGIPPGLSQLSPLYSEFSSEFRLSLTETVSLGLKEFKVLSVSRAEQEQRISEERLAGQILMKNVSDAYYSALETQKTISILEDINRLLEERLARLSERISVGRSRESEKTGALLILYQNQSAIEGLKSQEYGALRQLEDLTGLSGLRYLPDDEKELYLPESLEKYLEKLHSRPDVSAARYAMVLAGKTVAAARSDYFPSLNLSADAYAQNTGRFAAVNWDFSANVSVPILPIGNAGTFKQAKARDAESALRFEQVKKAAFSDISVSYRNFQSAISARNLYERTLAAAEEYYTLQEKDYRLNLINNLDLLLALQSLQDTRRNYIHSLYQAKRAYWYFMASIGETL